MVDVRFYGTIRSEFGSTEVKLVIKGTVTLREIMDALVEKYGQSRKQLDAHSGEELYQYVFVLINGVLAQGLATEVKPNDSIAVLPIVEGG